MHAITEAVTGVIGDYGLYAVFLLMFVDAVFPAASELVMVYAGALAAGAFPGIERDALRDGDRVDGLGLRRHGAGGDDRLHARLAPRLGDRPVRRPAVPRAARALAPRHARAKLDRAEAWFERYGDAAVFVAAHAPRRAVVHLHPGRHRARCRSAATPC